MTNDTFTRTILGALLFGGAATSVQASQTILFDTNGGGDNYVEVGSFDWLPGNALAQDAVTIGGVGSDPFQLWYQTSLGQILGPDGVTPVAYAGEYTFQMSYRETVVSSGPSSASFALQPGGTNFLNIYYDTAINANPIAGTGYDDGTLIWSGSVISDSSSFLVTTFTGGLLDQFGSDNQGGIQTLRGSGGGDTVARGNSWDTNFFDVDPLSPFISFFNTSLLAPFRQTNPSDLVVGQTPDYGTTGVNGLGDGFDANGFPIGVPRDFHFQADANMSFVVPEPTSLSLLGLGMAGLGYGARRRRV